MWKRNETLPACTLSWKDLSYSARSKKAILHDVSGRCGPGEFLAILGPSGSGKTTLLDLLADRISSGKTTGAIVLNGLPREPRSFRAVASYVAQDDTLLGSFTVLETLQFAARLSLPSTVSPAERDTRLQRVIDAMGLRSCVHTLVGDMFRKGLSGGQKRRLSIAIELLKQPRVLLLDEPTSGLDSATTLNVVQCIASLCRDDRCTVICTIHQPSARVFQLFDNVLLLAQGRAVYRGPPQAIVAHFRPLGYDCPEHTSPAEYYLRIVNTDFHSHADIDALADAVANTALHDQLLLEAAASAPWSVAPQRPSPLAQIVVFLDRNLLNTLRNPGIFWVRLVMYSLLSAMAGTMYMHPTPGPAHDANLVALLFGVPAFCIFMSVAALPFFLEQRAVFARERANWGVNVLSFVVANFVVALPALFMIALCSTSLVVPAAGLGGFGVYFGAFYLGLIVAESVVHVLGAAVGHAIGGIALGAGLFGQFMLCQGYLVARESIPIYWRWCHTLAFHSYVFQVLMHNEFAGRSPAILIEFNLEDVDIGRCIGVLVAYALLLQIGFGLVLYFVHTGRR
ncbi:hypothetical protein SDRG_11567 [Saprolegnia diclina VS20]|uniref:ABC transporter domain-containing protein n=1 Tax=Saprolegnia diclina (strain VS20) TaxID=1156394 RepID=T0RLF9_SAPDV|nr:hypothetical protein SDRG_11567 [Saprolegnia diclina VS20]EQC30807.1 hypothetical protein SDRG_11567 [Saprolegnia diclina VS20]|eukprot:XP_008615831.1 hypothetical protein SDRG_11567 [Saprolegnia diclina VS20]